MIKLIDLEVYKTAMEIGDNIWDIVDKWDFFNKDALGKQFVKAADSMALNIAEGYGRFFNWPIRYEGPTPGIGFYL